MHHASHSLTIILPAGRGCMLVGLVCSILTLGMLSGCGSSSATRGSDKATEEEIRTFESNFQPSEYDPLKAQPADRDARRADTNSVIMADSPSSSASLEMVQGYRVQVFSTTSIDAARAKRDEFEGAFPEEWFYLEYHAPTYKLRAGNFQNRFEADRFARMLGDQGFREAWTVPEKVYKSPGNRPPVAPQSEPQK